MLESQTPSEYTSYRCTSSSTNSYATQILLFYFTVVSTIQHAWKHTNRLFIHTVRPFLRFLIFRRSLSICIYMSEMTKNYPTKMFENCPLPATQLQGHFTSYLAPPQSFIRRPSQTDDAHNSSCDAPRQPIRPNTPTTTVVPHQDTAFVTLLSSWWFIFSASLEFTRVHRINPASQESTRVNRATSSALDPFHTSKISINY